MKPNFKELVLREKMILPQMPQVFKRVQRYDSNLSISFDFDEESQAFLASQLPFTCTKPLLKKIAENIILLNREKHRKTDIRRIELMTYPKYHGYQDTSFYISQI